MLMLPFKDYKGYTLFGSNRYVTHVYHEELKLKKITEKEKSNFNEWVFSWMFEKEIKSVEIR